MATAITYAVQAPEGGGSWRVLVRESFEEVLEAFAPLAGPSSALESRARWTFTTPDGRLVFLGLGAPVVLIEAEVDE